MQTKKNSKEADEAQTTEPPTSSQRVTDKENILAAHEQAEADIENDPEMSMGDEPGADLDEGELARLDNGDNVTEPA
jgi:hypothetical protein